MKPYFYKIQELSSGRIYVGCQYGEFSDPSNFWVNYFTSCEYIKSQEKSNFVVLYIKQREDAREYEERYLRRVYKFLGAHKFEKMFINRNLAPGILFTEDIRNKMSEGIKKSIVNRKLSGKYIPSMLGKNHTDETRMKISELKHNYYSSGGEHPKGMLNKKHSVDTKSKIRDSVVENAAMRGKFGEDHPTGGTVWWNNGISHKRCSTCPGDGWVQGRIFKKRK